MARPRGPAPRPAPPAGPDPGPELLPDPHAELMAQLEGLEEPLYAAFREWRQVFEVPHAINPRGAVALALSWSHAEERVRAALAIEADSLPAKFRSGPLEFEVLVDQFETAFQTRAAETATAILHRNRRLVVGEERRYEGAAGMAAVAELKTALEPFRPQAEEAGRLWKKADEEGTWDPVTGERRPDPILEEQAEKVEAELRHAVVMAHGGGFPVLADKDVNPRYLILATTAQTQARLLAVAAERRSNIDDTLKKIGNDASKAWRFDRAVVEARLAMQFVEGSIFDQIVVDRLARDKKRNAEIEFLLAALAMVLGLLTGGGGTVAVMAAIATAGLSIGVAVAHAQEYLEQSAAAGTAFDRAKAISSESPSLVWLALDILGAVGDLGAAVKLFRGLRPVALELKAAP